MATMAAKRANGFSLVELVIAIMILAIGVLGMAGTTALVVKQVTLADINTERAAAYQGAIERIRATNANQLTSGSQTSGSFSVAWTLTDSTSLSKTVRIITTGPGLIKDTSAVLPAIGSGVQDTITIIVLKP